MTEHVSYQQASVFLIDDHPAVREGLSLLLAGKGHVICGEAGCGEDALRLLANCTPDMVLVDLSLNGENGIELIKKLHLRGLTPLVYTMHDDARHIKSACAAGARGYVTKRELASTLLEAIDALLSGGRYLSPVAAQAVDEDTEGSERRLLFEKLSERERDIFRLVGDGYTTAELSAAFQISASTIETYYARIIEKLGFSGVKEMRRWIIHHNRQGD